MKVWASGSYRLLAIDGAEVNQPTDVSGRSVTAHRGRPRRHRGPRRPMTASAVRLQLSKATAVIIGPPGADVPLPPQPGEELDLLTYGSPAPLGFDPAQPTRRFDYLDRSPARIRQRPPGNVVVDQRPPLSERSDVRGPRGRCGRWCTSTTAAPRCTRCTSTATTWSCWPATAWQPTGSPWWVDSLNVAANESYDVAFVADNPGIWMDHCHNLKHAADGMVAHLMYEGFDTPYRIAGPADNRPE